MPDDLPGGPTDPEIQQARDLLYIAASPREPERTRAELLDAIKAAQALLDAVLARAAA
jgi:hypothetical protein